MPRHSESFARPSGATSSGPWPLPTGHLHTLPAQSLHYVHSWVYFPPSNGDLAHPANDLLHAVVIFYQQQTTHLQWTNLVPPASSTAPPPQPLPRGNLRVHEPTHNCTLSNPTPAQLQRASAFGTVDPPANRIAPSIPRPVTPAAPKSRDGSSTLPTPPPYHSSNHAPTVTPPPTSQALEEARHSCSRPHLTHLNPPQPAACPLPDAGGITAISRTVEGAQRLIPPVA